MTSSKVSIKEVNNYGNVWEVIQFYINEKTNKTNQPKKKHTTLTVKTPGTQQKMIWEREFTLWNIYSGSKTAHNKWKQNDKQQCGLLKLSFAEHKLLQLRPEQAIDGCLMLIFSFYSSSGSICILPRDPEPPCDGHLYLVSCLRPDSSSQRKANYCLNIRDLSLVGMDELYVAYLAWTSAYENPPLDVLDWFITWTQGYNWFVTRNQ